MKYDPQRHHRCSVRLRGYDYSQAGAYFITICTRNRELSLESEPVREVVGSTWSGLLFRFPGVVPDEFVIMPNHVHAIIVLEPVEREGGRGAASSGGAASSAPTLGQVVRAFKSLSGVEANRVLGRSGQPFWHRNYYERVIRNDIELDAVRRYIRDNPLRWGEDPDNPAHW